MKSLAVILTLLLSQEIRIQKNNPDGVWVAGTGSQYEMHLTGSDLLVKLVPGSNPKFLQYELNLKNEQDVNTYSGKGFFVAKMETGKECRLSTEWRFVIVSNDRIIGNASNVIADSQTCEVKETTQVLLDLTKKK